MESLIAVLKSRGILRSLKYYGPSNFATQWDVDDIIKNPDIFGNFYMLFPLKHIEVFDDYFLYMLSLKLAKLDEFVQYIIKDEHQKAIGLLAIQARNAACKIDRGSVITYIELHLSELLGKTEIARGLRYVTLDFIAQYNTGFNEKTFSYLCSNYAYQIIDKFTDFEKVFDRYPSLFTVLYPSGHFSDIISLRYHETLAIWHRMNRKPYASEIIKKYTHDLSEDLKSHIDNVSQDNYIQVEIEIQEFYVFLNKIKSPLANEFSLIASRAKLVSKQFLHEHGHAFQYEIPVDDILDEWAQTNNWILRLLRLTHSFRFEDEKLIVNSCIAGPPQPKQAFIDMMSTNIPSDDFFTISHQQDLSLSINIGAATIIGILLKAELLNDFINLFSSAIYSISEAFKSEDTSLVEGATLLSSMLRLLSDNYNSDEHVVQALCYNVSMYTCAYTESLMRALYYYLASDDIYIPTNKITMSSVLDELNKYMSDVFGLEHLKNLSYFFTSISPKEIGLNYRNSLAHWSRITRHELTLAFTAKILWLFIDVLNTTFWFLSKDTIEIEEHSE